MKHLLFVVLLLLPSSTAGAQTVNVLSGNTLEIGGVTMRLHGILAPRIDDICIIDGLAIPVGQFAADQLRSAIGDDMLLRCQPVDTQYLLGADFVVRCTVLPNVYRNRGRPSAYRDLARLMVERGAAWDYRKESMSINEPAEIVARRTQIGIWVGGCSLPSD